METYKDPKKLQEVYNKYLSLKKTAEFFGVSKTIIYYYVKKFNLSINPPDSERKADYKDPEKLEKAYKKSGSLTKTANYFGVSKKLILNHMKKFNIQRNDSDITHKDIDIDKALKLLNKGMTVKEVAKICNVSTVTLAKKFKKQGLKADQYHKGYIKTWAGYIKIYKPEHPRTDSKGYVHEHTLIMEKNLGRLLNNNEIVHHINEIKDDNRIENLELFDDWKKHIAFHKSKILNIT